MSQPYIIALMIQEACLAAESQVLDVGTGSASYSYWRAKFTKTFVLYKRIRRLFY